MSARSTHPDLSEFKNVGADQGSAPASIGEQRAPTPPGPPRLMSGAFPVSSDPIGTLS